MDVKGESYSCCCLRSLSLSDSVIVISLFSLVSVMDATTMHSVCPSKPGFPLSPSGGGDTRRNQLILDIDHPIQCNGTVMGWNICYYISSNVARDDPTETTIAATVGVWRISDGFYQLRGSDEISGQLGRELRRGFHCMTRTLLVQDRFHVEPGNVIGFHTHDAREVEVLDLHFMTSPNDNGRLLKRKDSTPSCRLVGVPRSVSLSCFENVTGAMRVHAMVEELYVLDETATTQRATNSPPITPPLPPATNSDDEDSLPSTPLPSTVSEDDSTRTDLNFKIDAVTTLDGQVDDLDQASAMTNRVISILSAAASIGGLILFTVIVIVIVLIIIVIVKYRRRQSKFKTKRDAYRHRHTGLNHFVVVSDMSTVPQGSILSSSVSLEPQHLHEGNESERSKHGNSMLENPGTSGVTALCNPTYMHGHGAGGHGIISSGENDCKDPNNCRSTTTDEVPIERLAKIAGAKGRESVHKENAGYAIVTKHRDTVKTETRNEQNEYDRTCHCQALAKAVSDPERYSVLCRHYYKVLEGVRTEENAEHNLKKEKFMAPAKNVEDLYAQVHKQKVKELSENDIKVLKSLGSGQFGNVSRGTWKSSKGVIEVAVKTLVTKEKKVGRVKLLQEAAIMGQFSHPNVIKLLGVVTCTKEDSLMLVIELASKGDLYTFLVAMRPDPGELLATDSDQLLLGYCQQVAFGMHYLSLKGFVHRDLAARNILVTQDNVLKIADFGMSRDLADRNYYISQGGTVPVKWTAPEAIHYSKYSTTSDVWSYGCLLYEIWSLGQAPFTDCSNSEALDKIQRGYRLPPPSGCPRAIYSIMINCWNPEPQVRPSFNGILIELHTRDNRVLKIPERDANSHKLASCIGGPLEAGEKMYTDLQLKYFL